MAKTKDKPKAVKAKKKDKLTKKEEKAARKAEKAAAKAEKEAEKAAAKAEKDAAKAVGDGYRQVAPSITSNDLAASLKFYTVLGFSIQETWKDPQGVAQGYSLKAGKTELMIGQDDFAKGKDRKKGEGMRLYLITKESVDKVAERVRAQGITLESEPADQSWGGRTFNVSDPDGVKLTVSSSW